MEKAAGNLPEAEMAAYRLLAYVMVEAQVVVLACSKLCSMS